MPDEQDPQCDPELPVATNTPDDVRSGQDEAAYNPPEEE